jgi:protein TonB
MLTSLSLHLSLLLLVIGSSYYRQSQLSLMPQIDVDLVDIEFTLDDQDLSKIRQRVLKQQKAAPVVAEKVLPVEKPVALDKPLENKDDLVLDPTLQKTLQDLKSPTVATSEALKNSKPIDQAESTDGNSDQTISSESSEGSSQIQKIKMSYEQYLISYISKYKTYPRIAERLKQQGMVYPQIRISKDGKLKDIVISKSSGFSSLDQGAINLIKSLAPFKPLPENLDGSEFTITIPIEYILAGS